MPISAIDGCEKEHWADVLEIVSESIDESGFDANLVSNADDVGIIQKRIIQNLYENPVCVCDVSGKNPNVMFELGLRLAFDKPTIIIKDDRTTYSFDTSPIEHLEYPRDLRFSKIVEFKEKLADKIKATHEKSVNDPNYTTFLKHFGAFTVAKIDKKEVPGQEIILEELAAIRTSLRRVERSQPRNGRPDRVTGEVDICLGRNDGFDLDRAADLARSFDGVATVEVRQLGPGHAHILAVLELSASVEQQKLMRSVLDGSRKSNLLAKN